MSAGAFNCDLCNIVLNCHQQYMQHRAGKKHLTKAKQKSMAAVTAASEPNQKTLYGGNFVSASSGQGNDFVGGESKNGAMNAGSDPVKAAVVQNLLGALPTKRKAPVVGECDLCGVIFNSTDQETMHLSGKRHAKKMRMAAGGEAGASFFCSFCNVKLNSIEQLEQHREGTKHQKKVASAKKVQDDARVENKAPTPATTPATTLATTFIPVINPAPPVPGGIPPPPAALENMKAEKQASN